jgi:hypothetical protein
MSGPHHPGANGAPTGANGASNGAAHGAPAELGGRAADALGAYGAAPARFAAEPWRPGARSGAAEAESVDLGDVARVIGRGWRTLLGGALVGAAVGAAVVAVFPPRWPGVATVLVRNANDPASSILTRFGIGGELGGGGGALGSVLKSPLETELQLIGSRDVLGDVVDSVGLHVRVLSPRGVPSRALVRPTHLEAAFRRRTYAFARQPDGTYRVEGHGARAAARPGGPSCSPASAR